MTTTDALIAIDDLITMWLVGDMSERQVLYAIEEMLGSIDN